MSVLRVVLIPILIVQASPGLSAKKPATKVIVQNLPKGWECLQGPNSLDHPGTVFYVDKNGVRFELGDLAKVINAQGGEVATMSASSNGNISAGLLAKILSLGGLLSLSFNKTYSASITLSQRQEFRTDEPHTRKALRTLDPSLLEEGNKYYVIRNTQVAKQMRLTVDRSIAGVFGGDAKFSDAVSLSGNASTPTPPKASPAPSGSSSVSSTPSAATETATPATGASKPTTIISAQDGKTFTIDQTFNQPLTVCFLAQRFTLTNVQGGVGGSIREAKLKDEYWTPNSKPELKGDK